MPSGEEFTDAPRPGRPSQPPPGPDEYSPTRRPARPDRPLDYPDEDRPDEGFSGDYSIDVNRWFGLAGENYSAILGASIGFILLAGIVSAVPYGVVFGVSQSIYVEIARDDPLQALLVQDLLVQGAILVLMPLLFFPLWSGMTAVYLAQVQGRQWTFGDFFAGFRHYGPLAGVGLAMQLLSVGLISLPSLSFTFAAVANHDRQMLLMSPLATLAGAVVLIFFQVRLFLFAPAIIFDRGLGAVEAVKANWELTRGHFWGLFGVSLLLGLINLGGVLACLVGLLFAIPFTALILTGGYVLISRRRPSGGFDFRNDSERS